jgi:hypothetical protein
VGRTLLIAGLCALIPLAGNVVASSLTEWTGGRSWLVVPAVGVGVAMLTALIQAYGSANRPSPRPQTPYPEQHPEQPWPGHVYPHPPPRRQERRATPLPVALLIALLVMGVGGWGVTQGVRYAVGSITGNESGSERLIQPAAASADGLTLTVESVERTTHFTRVRLAARNRTATSLSLPLFGNCVFIGGDGTTLEADPFRSRWSETLAPGGVQRGAVTFNGHVPDSVTRASLSFTQIFRLGGGSITVRDIRLRPG